MKLRNKKDCKSAKPPKSVEICDEMEISQISFKNNFDVTSDSCSKQENLVHRSNSQNNFNITPEKLLNCEVSIEMLNPISSKHDFAHFPKDLKIPNQDKKQDKITNLRRSSRLRKTCIRSHCCCCCQTPEVKKIIDKEKSVPALTSKEPDNSLATPKIESSIVKSRTPKSYPVYKKNKNVTLRRKNINSAIYVHKNSNNFKDKISAASNISNDVSDEYRGAEHINDVLLHSNDVEVSSERYAVSDVHCVESKVTHECTESEIGQSTYSLLAGSFRAHDHSSQNFEDSSLAATGETTHQSTNSLFLQNEDTSDSAYFNMVIPFDKGKDEVGITETQKCDTKAVALVVTNSSSFDCVSSSVNNDSATEYFGKTEAVKRNKKAYSSDRDIASEENASSSSESIHSLIQIGVKKTDDTKHYMTNKSFHDSRTSPEHSRISSASYLDGGTELQEGHPDQVAEQVSAADLSIKVEKEFHVEDSCLDSVEIPLKNDETHVSAVGNQIHEGNLQSFNDNLQSNEMSSTRNTNQDANSLQSISVSDVFVKDRLGSSAVDVLSQCSSLDTMLVTESNSSSEASTELDEPQSYLDLACTKIVEKGNEQFTEISDVASTQRESNKLTPSPDQSCISEGSIEDESVSLNEIQSQTTTVQPIGAYEKVSYPEDPSPASEINTKVVSANFSVCDNEVNSFSSSPKQSSPVDTVNIEGVNLKQNFMTLKDHLLKNEDCNKSLESSEDSGLLLCLSSNRSADDKHSYDFSESKPLSTEQCDTLIRNDSDDNLPDEIIVSSSPIHENVDTRYPEHVQNSCETSMISTEASCISEDCDVAAVSVKEVSCEFMENTFQILKGEEDLILDCEEVVVGEEDANEDHWGDDNLTTMENFAGESANSVPTNTKNLKVEQQESDNEAEMSKIYSSLEEASKLHATSSKEHCESGDDKLISDEKYDVTLYQRLIRRLENELNQSSSVSLDHNSDVIPNDEVHKGSVVRLQLTQVLQKKKTGSLIQERANGNLSSFSPVSPGKSQSHFQSIHKAQGELSSVGNLYTDRNNKSTKIKKKAVKLLQHKVKKAFSQKSAQTSTKKLRTFVNARKEDQFSAFSRMSPNFIVGAQDNKKGNSTEEICPDPALSEMQEYESGFSSDKDKMEKNYGFLSAEQKKVVKDPPAFENSHSQIKKVLSTADVPPRIENVQNVPVKVKKFKKEIPSSQLLPNANQNLSASNAIHPTVQSFEVGGCEDYSLSHKENSFVPSDDSLQKETCINDVRIDEKHCVKPEKIKSRWRKSLEADRSENQDPSSSKVLVHALHGEAKTDSLEVRKVTKKEPFKKLKLEFRKEIQDKKIPEHGDSPEQRPFSEKKIADKFDFEMIEENVFLIDSGYRCPMGDKCGNRNFQSKIYKQCVCQPTEKKGIGLFAAEDIPEGSFIMEYVGEVIDPKEFRRRSRDVAKLRKKHFYFMALKNDEIIDATFKGNLSRYINHSCDPNAETQKWTVNGELRIGFFSIRKIETGEEITFDYQYQRYGKEAQRCYCNSSNCRGWIGEDPGVITEMEERKDVKRRKEDKPSEIVEMLEDMDLEQEIAKLQQTGIKNRNQTLTLSRLMIRAEDLDSRQLLLQLLQDADEACRRLFLDYHGLKVLWSWMVDINNEDSSTDLKIQLLKTLQQLPIPHKTMLIESKLLSVVQRWCSERSCEDDDDVLCKRSRKDTLDSEGSAVLDMSEQKSSVVAMLAAQLLDQWSGLKDIFKIPRMKERLQSRKEHEREADKENMAQEAKAQDKTRSWEGMRWQRVYKERFKKRLLQDKGLDGIRSRERELSKELRRQLFEQKVAAEDEEKRRQTELWQRHQERCHLLGCSPELTPSHDSESSQFFDPNSGLWLSCSPGPKQNSLPAPCFPTDTSQATLWSSLPAPQMIPFHLPSNWKFARDSKGRFYYYHKKYRCPQWDPPLDISEDSSDDACSSSTSEESEEDKVSESGGSAACSSESFQVMSHPPEPSVETTDEAPKLPEAKKTAKKEKLIQEVIISPRREGAKRDFFRPQKVKTLKPHPQLSEADKRPANLLNESDESQDKGDEESVQEDNQQDSVCSPSPSSPMSAANPGESLNKIKDRFRAKISSVVVHTLNPYRHANCVQGHIATNEDFKHLARKLTHFVLLKEMKHCRKVEDLTVNDSVKHKARDFVRKYMLKFGEEYRRSPDKS